MSDTTTTVVEVAPAPPTTTPTPPDKPAKSAAPVAAAVPGLPLAVAAANTAGGLTAGALALGGPATLATAGAVAGAAAVGALGRRARANRARTRQATPLHHTPRQAGNRGAARPAPLGSVPQARRAGSAAAWTGRPMPGSGSGPARSGTAARAHRATDAPSVTAPRQRPVAAGTGRGSAGPAFTLAKAARTAARGGTGAGAAGRWPLPSPQRAAKAEARTARNLAKGHAKAMRRAGIDPATGAAKPGKPGKGLAELRAATPEQAKKLRRSAWRYRARMAAAGLATGLVGAASVAAFNWRHPGRVTSHMRRTWQRLATRARAAREARDAAILGGAAGTPDASGVPVPAESVQQPGTTSAASALKSRTAPALAKAGRVAARISIGKPTVQEATVSDQQSTVPAFSLSSAADVMLQAASTFDPEHMTEFGVLADDLPVAFATIQEVLRVLAEQGRESLPLDPVVSEEIAQGYQAMGRVVSALENVAPVFRQAHADDLERNENPRNGLEAERKWNV
ncbi:hypothetical protein BX265_1837 [Streptomyces sp. TLI_235]|nr:hypothetical protein [Streptomyces sp. TLI_235]PBC77100.1 hypothetical protein BX265_1837 [Streptomyces sp. TLI_235]